MALRIFSALMLVLASIFYVPTASAQTTNNDGYRVDNVTLKPYPQSVDADGNLYEWSGLEVEFDWSAPKGGVQAGDEFTIKFPKDDNGAPLLGLKQSREFDLVDTNGQSGGTCVAHEAKGEVTCHPDDRFVDKDDVHGTIRVAAATRGVNANLTSYAFTIGKGSVEAYVPGNKGIVGRGQNFPENSFKSGWMENDGRTLTWVLYVPGKSLPSNPSMPLHITDAIPADSSPHTFKCAPDQGYIVPQGPGNFRVQALGFRNSSDVLKDLDNNAKSHLGVTAQTFENNNKTMHLTVNPPEGGWKSDEGYRIKYHTCVDSPVAEGVFKNGAKAENIDFGTHVVDYKDDASGTIGGVSRKGYQITKKIAADSAPIDANQEFEVTVKVDADDDRFDSTDTIKLKADKTYVSKKELPAGTRVTVSEENLPKVSGLTFKDPQYSADEVDNPVVNGNSVTVKISNDKNADIKVTNSATGKPKTTGGGLLITGGGSSGGSSEGSSAGSSGLPLWVGLLAVPLLAAGVVGSSAVGSSAVGSSNNGPAAAPAAAPGPNRPAGQQQAAPAGNGGAPAAAPAKGIPAGQGGGQQATPTSAAPAAAQAEKTLANTGVRVIEIVGAALAVLVLGVVLLVVRSRRAR